MVRKLTRRVVITWMQSMIDLIALHGRRMALGAWLVLVIMLVIVIGKLNNLNTQNHDRINDIQRSRLESCVTTYNSFHAIFDPFLPKPDKQTATQRKQVQRFDKIIAAHIKKCRAQVTPPAIHH